MIKENHIKIGQLLKIAGVVNSGAEVKGLISAEEIFLNGEKVSQRGKKVRKGDTVIYRETEIYVC